MDHQLSDFLKRHGSRVTAPRRILFRALRAGAAQTTAELRAKTAGRLDTASLYRALALFRELGIIHDVVIAGKRKVELTDVFSPHHHHLACSQCGKTYAIHDDAFERHIELLAASRGFSHESHSFEISGRCPACAGPTASAQSAQAV